jgi:hypothetical protein
MPRGPFSAPLAPTSITTTVDFFHITAAAENAVTLIAVQLYNTTDVQEAQEEILSMALARTVTGGTGGSGLTEVNYHDAGGSAPTATVLGLNTTVSTAGTVLMHDGWNVRVPYLWCPIPELRPTVDSTQDPIVLRLLAAPADAITIGGCIYWYEQ